MWNNAKYVGMKRMLRLMENYLHEAKMAEDKLNELRAEYEISPHFEMGYVMSELLERYRKIVEQARRPLLYKADTVLDALRTLELVQRLFFEIYHLVNIIHETPRKYERDKEFRTDKGDDASMVADAEKRLQRLEKERRRRKRQWIKEVMKMHDLAELQKISERKPSRPNNRWWPIDYGWEIDYYW